MSGDRKECLFFEEQISAYVDGELNLEEEKELKEHLAVCNSCLQLLDEMEAMHTFFYSAEEIPHIPASVKKNVLREIKPSRVKHSFRWKMLGNLAAGVVIIVLSATFSILPIMQSSKSAELEEVMMFYAVDSVQEAVPEALKAAETPAMDDSTEKTMTPRMRSAPAAMVAEGEPDPEESVSESEATVEGEEIVEADEAMAFTAEVEEPTERQAEKTADDYAKMPLMAATPPENIFEPEPEPLWYEVIGIGRLAISLLGTLFGIYIIFRGKKQLEGVKK